ncbi:antitermination protein [Raoultella ornithinolytica]|uniref:antitermination protein n=1 Tax=Raoultella ornithinolytica TaxID=54291 RepID=UPI002FF3DB81
MNLENCIKFHSAKTTQISDSPRATASDSLTGTDVMAAMGMAQSREEMGYSAFLGKMGISSNDREKAIELLTLFAHSACVKVPALRELDDDIKPKVMQVLATFAFEDYSRSAASTRMCECCGGNKFIEVEVFTNKVHTPRIEKEFVKMSLRMGVEDIQPSAYEVHRSVREVGRVLCHKCKGKGMLSNACQCHGKGLVLDREKTEQQGGVPAYKTCSKCNGRGYARLPAENVRRALCASGMELSQPTWSRNWKPFYESLIERLFQVESHADMVLKTVTR